MTKSCWNPFSIQFPPSLSSYHNSPLICNKCTSRISCIFLLDWSCSSKLFYLDFFSERKYQHYIWRDSYFAKKDWISTWISTADLGLRLASWTSSCLVRLMFCKLIVTRNLLVVLWSGNCESILNFVLRTVAHPFN